MKLVLDTNVVLDWLVFRDASVADLLPPLDAGRVELITHAPAIDELRRVLTYTHLKLPPHRQQQILEQYLSQTRSGALPEGFDLDDLKLPAAFPRCRDCDDQHFLALAYHERADALVSKDRAVLKLRKRARRFNVTILDPRQLASMLNGAQAPRHEDAQTPPLPTQ
ncbi:putative toxin-antitoxin system toxin component, PIN family [Steroidobacter sp. S1-65]|uniref:Toxin-antitoxin system toxin component, PIN family n=1 Tax=Steroidobacter gossypii TaxID=2805490 RepID=A0ABS1X2D6_9GAMM|nr:putative toxin-antitoxin system toxin component, PIN family [Steroidobacter gossypii]MBM0107361.1 putative toxin-antitoxin system toxin component, PIN family [Steroidobacter gossypii]